MPHFDDWLKCCLEKSKNINLIARDVDSKELLGVVMIDVESNQEKDEVDDASADNLPLCNQVADKMQTILTFLDWVKRDLNIEEDYGAREWAEVLFLTCNIKKRIPGLGTDLMHRATQAVEDAGLKIVYTTATSHFSGKIFHKLGYSLVEEIPYTEYKIDDKIVFPTADPHSHVRLYLKKLN